MTERLHWMRLFVLTSYSSYMLNKCNLWSTPFSWMINVLVIFIYGKNALYQADEGVELCCSAFNKYREEERRLLLAVCWGGGWRWFQGVKAQETTAIKDRDWWCHDHLHAYFVKESLSQPTHFWFWMGGDVVKKEGHEWHSAPSMTSQYAIKCLWDTVGDSNS